jgi:hypothetical protein
MLGIQSDKERDYVQQIAELQSKLSQLMEEQQVMKMRNIAVSSISFTFCFKLFHFISRA